MAERLYRIVVEPRLHPAIREEAFGGLSCRDGSAGTELIGWMDQSALFGYLHRIEWLALVLVEVGRLDDSAGADEAAAPEPG